MVSIYKITNILNGMCYIGQTKRDPARRWYEHQWETSRSNLPLHNAIRKYGTDSFMFEVIDSCDYTCANELEIYYIDKYDTFNNGYNKNIGGNCFMSGENHLASGIAKSDAHKKAIAEKHIGIPKKENRGTGNGAFKVWSYVTPTGEFVLCDNISKRDFCKKYSIGKDKIQDSIRYNRPVKKGKLKGYQFFGGGFADSIKRNNKGEIMSLIEDIKQEEGFRQFIYLCTEGRRSIGYGFNLDDVGISEEEADAILQIRVTKLIRSVQSSLYYLEIKDEAWDILYHMAYQIGLNGLMKFKKMIEALKNEDYILAGKEMLSSRWAAQTPNRAKRLSDRMRNI